MHDKRTQWWWLMAAWAVASVSTLGAQPEWADRSAPNIGIAFDAAARAGLDMRRPRKDREAPEIQALLPQDIEDLTALQVNKTPTFLVNGRGLPSFGPEQLARRVAEEVGKVQP